MEDFKTEVKKMGKLLLKCFFTAILLFSAVIFLGFQLDNSNGNKKTNEGLQAVKQIVSNNAISFGAIIYENLGSGNYLIYPDCKFSEDVDLCHKEFSCVYNKKQREWTNCQIAQIYISSRNNHLAPFIAKVNNKNGYSGVFIRNGTFQYTVLDGTLKTGNKYILKEALNEAEKDGIITF
jgi:hypothetical protein